MARVLIISDSEAMTYLLKTALGAHPRIEIVGSTWTVEDAVRVTGELTPDLVVVASGSALQEGTVSLAEEVYQANSNAVVVVTSSTLAPALRKQLLDVCAIPLETDIMDLAHALEELIPDLRARSRPQRIDSL